MHATMLQKIEQQYKVMNIMSVSSLLLEGLVYCRVQRITVSLEGLTYLKERQRAASQNTMGLVLSHQRKTTATLR